MCTIVHSVVGDPFKEWVKSKIDTRNEEYARKKDQLVDMAPTIAAALLKTNQLTSGHGNVHNMLKASFKRKRSKEEIEAEKQQQAAKENALVELQQQMLEL